MKHASFESVVDYYEREAKKVNWFKRWCHKHSTLPCMDGKDRCIRCKEVIERKTK